MTVTEPIALDKSINTTEVSPRNIADVLAEELARIAENILPPNAEDIAYDNTESGLTATNVQDAIDEVISSQSEVIADTMADLTENKTATVTDGVADFETIDGSLVKSLIVEIEPSQSGYTQEDVTVVGKNRLPITATSQTMNGITFTVNTDGTITVNGTSTGQAYINLYNESVSCPYNGYILSGCPSGGSNTTYDLRASDVDTTSNPDYGDGKIINLTNTGKWRVQIFIRSGVTVNNLVFKPMIRLATSSAEFEPYHGKTYTTQFGQSITAGGTLDFLTGELTTGGSTLSLTPQTVKALVGENHISASTGDVTECKFSMMINGDDLAQLL